MSMIEDIKRYVEGGKLGKDSFRLKDMHMYPFVSFVSLNAGIVRLLVCGNHRDSASNHLRNVEITHFCDTIEELIQKRFPIVQAVRGVMTFDEDFPIEVHKHGGNITYPLRSIGSKPYVEIMNLMLRQHPDIASCGSMVLKREDRATQADVSQHQPITWEKMIDLYDGAWMIGPGMRVSQHDGSVWTYEDMNGPLPGSFPNNPSNLRVQTAGDDPRRYPSIARSKNDSFFAIEKYKFVVIKPNQKFR